MIPRRGAKHDQGRRTCHAAREVKQWLHFALCTLLEVVMMPGKIVTALVPKGSHAGRFRQSRGLRRLVFAALVALLAQANVFGQFNVAASYPLSETFDLHSLPGATKTIYLDFDGHNGFFLRWRDRLTPRRTRLRT